MSRRMSQISEDEMVAEDGTRLVAAPYWGCSGCFFDSKNNNCSIDGPSLCSLCSPRDRQDKRGIIWVRPGTENPAPASKLGAADSDRAPASELDPSGMAAHEPGAKLDAGKNQVWLCISGFSRALESVAQVTTVGARKYSPNGWKQVEGGADRYMEAFGRHMLALGKGEIVDAGPGGTGCLHKAQMIWNLLASLELELEQWTPQ